MTTDTHSQKSASLSRIVFSMVVAVLWCGNAFSQQSGEPSKVAGLEEITVTAQRRAQSVNDIPISVSAFGGEDLRDRGVQNFNELAEIMPNVAMNSFFASRAEISIRGVAMSESWWSTDQPPVGVYLDDVFLGSRAVHLSQIFDLERVEVLRGPQGVLFGRNTTAGAVNYISKAPDETLGGFVNASYGNYGTAEISGAFNIPINDAWGVRLSGKTRTSDGWARNVNTDTDVLDYDSWAARAVVQYSGESATWTLNVHGSDYEGHENYYFNSAIPENEGLDWDEFNQQQDDTVEDIDAWGVSLTGSIELSNFDITSITAYETTDYFGYEDFSVGITGVNNAGQFVQFGPYADGSTDDFEQFSQELRISGNTDNIDWVGGVLFYSEDVDSQYSDGAFGLGTIGLDFNGNTVIEPDQGEGWFPEDDRRIWNQTTDEVAAFVHIDYSINNQWSIFGGIRYTDSKKELAWQYTDEFTGFDYVPRTELEDSWDPLTYRAGLEYKPNSESLYYFRFDHGFKNGGFSVGGSTLADLVIVNPEEIDSFELGAKLTLADGSTQLNIAAFYNEIDDYQANLIVFGTNGIGFALTNAAKVETKGFELELATNPTDNLRISGGLGYTDAIFASYVDTELPADYSGNRIPVVPEWSGNVSISYDAFLNSEFVLTPRIDYSYTSEMEGRHQNRPQEVLDSRSLLNVRLTLGSESNDAWNISAWVRNALDEEYRTKIVGDSAFAAGLMEKRGWPRTYGVSVEYSW